MPEESRPTPVVQTPLGIYPARVDERGRLKLPTDFQEFLKEVFLVEGSEQRLFITSLDLLTIRIYPVSVWKFNENLLEQDTEDPQTAADLAFLAKDMGGASEIDSQGRVLLPSPLRDLLKLNGEPVPVYLECYKGRISVLTEEGYQAQRTRARENAAEKAARMEKRGLR
jgi:MraZ protein